MLQTRTQQCWKLRPLLKTSYCWMSLIFKRQYYNYACSSSTSVNFMFISIHSIHSWLLGSGNCGLQVVQKRADMTELLQEEASDPLDNRIQRALPKKKSEVKILVISHWRFAILRHTVYQKSLFWTEICKEPNGHVRYIQNLPCTIFSHTHKTAEDDNHRHKLLQMAHVSPIPIVQQRWGSTFQALARTKVECVLPADTEHKGLLTLGSSTADMDRSTMSLRCDAQTPHTSVAFNQA